MQTGDFKQITVDLDKPYSIFVGENIKHLLKHNLSDKRIFAVTDTNVFGFYKGFFEELNGEVFVIKAGEQSKNIDVLQKIYDFLLDNYADRYSFLVAVGGGVVGDIGGFAASTYMRGMELVHVPTTLLAMVDSSIGGKTAINYGGYKNIVGSFYQPQSVFIDVEFLNTLPEREYISAFAEIVKYGIIKDKKLFRFIENNVDFLRGRDSSVLLKVVEMSVKNKIDIVRNDEKENGLRATLNFGHTFAHAIESITGYERYLHGEAVSIGIVLASMLSFKIGILNIEDAKRIKNVLFKLGLPVKLDFNIDKNKFYEIMLKDKKNRERALRFVLTMGIGSSIITDGIEKKVVEEVIEENV